MFIADAYVSDEIIVARSGKRIRIGNTDAEGAHGYGRRSLPHERKGTYNRSH